LWLEDLEPYARLPVPRAARKVTQPEIVGNLCEERKVMITVVYALLWYSET
jgi:hypothetical protein